VQRANRQSLQQGSVEVSPSSSTTDEQFVLPLDDAEDMRGIDGAVIDVSESPLKRGSRIAHFQGTIIVASPQIKQN
jgi:hypothetical protein